MRRASPSLPTSGARSSFKESELRWGWCHLSIAFGIVQQQDVWRYRCMTFFFCQDMPDWRDSSTEELPIVVGIPFVWYIITLFVKIPGTWAVHISLPFLTVSFWVILTAACVSSALYTSPTCCLKRCLSDSGLASGVLPNATSLLTGVLLPWFERVLTITWYLVLMFIAKKVVFPEPWTKLAERAEDGARYG